jgi:hypothetical protein
LRTDAEGFLLLDGVEEAYLFAEEGHIALENTQVDPVVPVGVQVDPAADAKEEQGFLYLPGPIEVLVASAEDEDRAVRMDCAVAVEEAA